MTNFRNLLLLLFLLPAVLHAEPVTPAKARSLAASFMKTSAAPQQVKRKAVAQSAEEYQPLYIFSRGEGQGYVLVSGDDLLPAIIGYTESGDFDEANLPPALQDMIDYYTQAAQALQTDTAMAVRLKSIRKSPRKASGTKDIATLMTSHHHQSWPYNLLCPYLKGTTNLAATGCVATAASQIIYYWRKDMNDRTKYATPTYSYGDAPVTTSFPSGTPLKWDLMKDSYSSSDPAEYTNAIATLVAVTGASTWLTYGSSTSGQISDAAKTLVNQFDLTGASTVWRDSYSQSSWEKMIVADLEAGYPILYSGVHPSSGGHAVVVDGYQLSTNLFHFNFGWGGQGDGYYTVDGETGMNGFNDSQGMVHNIHPKNYNVTGKIIYNKDYLLNRVDNTITATVTNNSTLAQCGYYLYCLTGTNKPSGSSSAQAKDETTVVGIGETAKLTFSFSPASTQSYSIYLCDANKNILDKVENISTVASVPGLTLNGLRADDGGESEYITVDGQQIEVKHIFNTGKVNIMANFTNNGDEATLCNPSVKGLYYTYDETAGQFSESSSSKTKRNVTFEVGETADIVFDLTNLTDGTIYKFKLDGTANTNKSFDITYAADADTVVYFKLVGADMTAEMAEDSTTLVIKGHYNSQIFNTLNTDESISRYDMTQTAGVAAPLSAANKNALFYTQEGISGTNIVSAGICENLDLTPGYDFNPVEDFTALTATYHANQAIGQYGTAYIPFDVDVPTGMFARKVNLIRSSYLQEVDSCNYEIKGGTPYIILTGKEIDLTAERVPVSIETPSLSTDTIRGTWVNRVGSSTNYMLNDDDTQYFENCEGVTIPALTAYLEYTKKVRATSYPYNSKDKKAKQLAAQIAAAHAAYEEYAYATDDAAKATLMAAIEEAEDTLHTQPLTTYQSEQVNLLEEAIAAYIFSTTSTTEDGYQDVTSLIVNPSFELTSTFQGWDRSNASAVTSSRITSSLANYMSGADGNVVTKITEDNTVSQTVTGLENGTYQLLVSVAADYDGHILIFAGNDTVSVDATDFGPMYMIDGIVDDIEVTDGTLTIGATTAESWAKVDNFRLYQKSIADAIDNIYADKKTTTLSGIYDLQGRRLNAVPEHGIYIKDGRKVIR